LPDLRKDESEEIRFRTWSIDCPRMIVKKKTKRDPDTFYGAGEIRISEDGQLIFKLYSNRERNTKEWDFSTLGDPGRIIPDDAYYSLKAVDAFGRDWASDRFLPSTHRTATGRAVLTGNLHELSTEGMYPSELNLSGNNLDYWVFDDLKIPYNASTIQRKSVARGEQTSRSGKRNAWRFRSYNSRFLVVRESSDLLTIQVVSKTENLPELFPDRLIEALQFVIGHPINWGIMKHRAGQHSKVTIRSVRYKTSQIRFQPPLPLKLIRNPNNGKSTAEYHRKLFDRYLRYTLEEDKLSHPIWGKLNAIYEASDASFIDAQALTLTVAIESLLLSEFRDLGYPTQKERNAIEDIVQHIDTWNGDERIKNRAKGMLSNLGQPRAVARMDDLANKRKAISVDQSKSWQRLRNPSTHAYQSSGIETPEFLELIQQCMVLFYHLIFYAIGYRGPYIDYGSRGWPLKKYPGNTLWS